LVEIENVVGGSMIRKFDTISVEEKRLALGLMDLEL
jgi:hypothetical protein